MPRTAIWLLIDFYILVYMCIVELNSTFSIFIAVRGTYCGQACFACAGVVLCKVIRQVDVLEIWRCLGGPQDDYISYSHRRISQLRHLVMLSFI